MTYLYCLILGWLSICAAALLLPGERLRKVASGLIPLIVLSVLFYFGPALLPWQRLLSTSLGLLYVIKSSILLGYKVADIRSFSPLGLALYMTLWPGMNPEPLRCRCPVDEDGTRFARGFIFCFVGLLLALTGALIVPMLPLAVAGFYGIAALLLIVHFGYADMLTSLMRLAGWNVGPLFEKPLLSGSLRDFWSRRWNLAFVEMDRILFLKPLARRLGVRGAVFCVFIISGLLHDICLSYSAWAGWGMPLLYFVLQGALVALEQRLKVEKVWPLAWRRIWTWLWLLAPLPLLFTAPLRLTFILPLMQFGHDQLLAHPLAWYFDLALWCAALGNFCTMGAGLQVPYRLHWHEELAKLTSFNRKIFLNYAAYVLLIIISFGILTIVLHDDLMRGERSAVALSILMGCFWGLRVLVDFFWFNSKDWPKGPMFVIGHACLTGLFVALTATYLGLAIWHLCR